MIPPAPPELVADASGAEKTVVEPTVVVMSESPDEMTDTMAEVVTGTLLAAPEPS